MAFVSCLCLMATLDNFCLAVGLANTVFLFYFVLFCFVYLLVMLTTSFGEIQTFHSIYSMYM